jgi:hypothetical protein
MPRHWRAHCASQQPPLIAVKSCNQGLWRADLIAVNGFNEEFGGWGPEDKELILRVRRHGTRRQSLLFGGIASHLHHAPAARRRLSANEAIFAASRASGAARWALGISAHRGVDTVQQDAPSPRRQPRSGA